LDFNGLVGQPTEGALLALAFKSGMDDLRKDITRVEEVPFDSETKWMAVRCQAEGRYLWYAKGSVEALMPRCTAFYHSSMSKLEVMDAYSKLAGESLRVIALAYGDDLHNLIFVGLVGIMDPPRRGVREAISKTRASNIKVVMITGDSKETAISIAKDLGIYDTDSISLSCTEMESMTELELSNVLDRVSVFYRMAPGHKMKIVNSFRSKGQIVAMTGDGVNDAPALKMADIGIAMGRGGSDVCRESAEMILVDNNFSTIEAAIEEGKSIFTNIKSFLRFQLSTSVAALATTAFCTLSGHPLPLNPMQILWINIIMDGPPAQSLTFEGLTQDAMKEPPRNPNTPVIDQPMIIKIVSAAAMMVVGTMWVFLGEVHDEDSDTRQSTTMAFTTFVMFQMFNALNCRGKKSIFQLGLTTNKFFTFAIGGSLFMQLLVIYLPFFQYIFETAPLSFPNLLKCVIVGSTVFIMDEIWKMIEVQKMKEQRSL
jgi:Ca2+-transporting ATPase